MVTVDSAILDATEWCCRRFQILTGRTNVWLAVQFTNLSIVVYFVWAAVYFRDVEIATRIAVGIFCALVLYVLTQTVFKVSIESVEQNAYSRTAKGLRNPRRIRDASLRMSFLTLSVLLSYPTFFLDMDFQADVGLLGYWLVVLMTVVLYVLACDPLPPCTGKIANWIHGLAPLATKTMRPSRIPSP